VPPTPYVTPTAFEALLRTVPLSDIAREHILTGLPYVFRRAPADFDLLRNHLATELRLATKSIQVVGSARTGFSLDPNGFPRPFSSASDVDVVVVCPEFFDHIWFTLLDWNYPRRYRLVQPDRRWSHARQDDLYWGWFNLDRLRDERLSYRGALKPIRDLSTLWFNAFRSLSTYPSLSTLSIEGRLYRSWEHVLLYHTDGLARLRGRLP
jgi:hypothetical protein